MKANPTPRTGRKLQCPIPVKSMIFEVEKYTDLNPEIEGGKRKKRKVAP